MQVNESCTSVKPCRPLWGLLLLFLFGPLTWAQQAPIKVPGRADTLSELIQTVERQSPYRFVYNSDKISPDLPVALSGSYDSLEALLQALSAELSLRFSMQQDQIILLESAQQGSQGRTITGKVVFASDGAPMPGATVLIQGTGKGALTDAEGNFTYLLRTSDIANTMLEVNYLGMKKISRRVGNGSYFLFEMEEETNELSQVVVTSSYGTKKLREELVGSISTLTPADLPLNQASESVDKLLDGQLAGVYIENTTGVGAPVKINIRGQGSLSPLGNPNLGTSTQPLIIIDGVIMTEEMAIDNSFFDGSGNFAERLGNPLTQIAAEDIESINVLKDAAAVSIYGADGANGVILITTKKGKADRMRFGFSSQIGVSEAINQIKYLNGEQYTELRNAYLTNTGRNTVPYNGVNTDWFDLLNRAGTFNRYNFNLSGGAGRLNYRSSLTYMDIDEPQLGNGSQQLNLNLNLGYTIGKLGLNLSLTPSMVDQKSPNTYYSYAFVPTLDPFNEDGSFADLGLNGLPNPLAGATQNRNLSSTRGVLGSFSAEYQLLPELKISSLFGMDFKDKEQDRYFSSLNESGRLNGTFVLDGVTYPKWGRRILNDRKSVRWNWQTSALFSKSWGDHDLDGLAGFELSEEKTDFAYANGSGFVNPEILNPVEDALKDDNPNTPEDESRENQSYQSDINYNSRVSFYAQLNYDFLDKYFALVNFRRDQSSVFGKDSDVAYNGGLGLGWNLSQEAFLKDLSWLDFMKLRTSYGTTGNSRIGSYRSKGLYQTGDNGYNGLPEAYPTTAPNPELGWEKNTKFNLGLDFRIFDRVSVTAEYFHDLLQDLITTRDLPTEVGYNSLQLNAATMVNQGFELSATVDWIRSSNLNWTTTFNLATLNNEVTELVGLGSDYSIAANALAQKIGHSTSTIWGVQWEGIDPATGRDLVSYQGQVYDAATYRSLFDNSNWVPLADRQPDVYGGFSNSFRFFKDLTLSVRGSYQLGGAYLVSHELLSQYNITVNRNLSVNAYDFWRGPGDSNALQPIVINNNPVIPNMSKYLYDLTHLKISNINLNYQIPVREINIPLDQLSVFVDVSNVAYWYKDKSPEGRNGIREFRFTYPQARTISFGLKTSF